MLSLTARQQLRYLAEKLSPHWPKATQLLLDAEEDILAYMVFPKAHWTRIYPTNVLEELNNEVKRRTTIVEIFPDGPSVIRLVGTLLAGADDEWQSHRRYFSQESLCELYEPELARLVEPTPLTLALVH